MHLITEIYETDVHPELERKEGVCYTIRKAARAILFRDDLIAILSVTKHKYHKLPGGGIDKGETVQEALARELLEETGCQARILSDLGVTIEYRDKIGQLQISYVYVAAVIGGQHEIHLTEKEKREGFALVWMRPEEAFRLMKEEDTPKSYSGPSIQKRDLAILAFFLQSQKNAS